MKTIIPVILCGGSGTRLWPASREAHPKQFLKLVDDYSLLQNTMMRAIRVSGAKPGNVVTVTGKALAHKVRDQLSAIDINAARHVLCEPVARNTAAAVAYAALYVRRVFGKDTALWILPADHHIGNEEEMTKAFRQAMSAAEEGELATFGIRPTRPDTGYGYIRLGSYMTDTGVRRADSFVEKPNLETAKKYVADGNYLWNSGMFLFSTQVLLNEYMTHAASLLRKVSRAMESSSAATEPTEEKYAEIPEAPFDKAIMEKSAKVVVVPCDPVWSDIGSWESLWEIREKDGNGNVINGNAVCYSTRDCLIQADKKLIACAGVENLVVIETGDALLIANRSDAESMRALMKALKAGGYQETSVAAPSHVQHEVAANLPEISVAVSVENMGLAG